MLLLGKITTMKTLKFIPFLCLLILTSCSAFDAYFGDDSEKMFGTWTGNSKGRFLEIKILENNSFTLKDSISINGEIGNPTMCAYYEGKINEDGMFSIYQNAPWSYPKSIDLNSRSGYINYYLNGEKFSDEKINKLIKVFEGNNPEGSKLGITSKGTESDDPNVDGWFIRTQWFDAVYFNTINYRVSSANMAEIKLTKLDLGEHKTLNRNSNDTESKTTENSNLLDPNEFYIINISATKNESEAIKKKNMLIEDGYNSDYLWIPDYKSLSGAEYYCVYIGPYNNISDCEIAIENYRKVDNSAYALLVSQKNKRVEIRGPGKIKVTDSYH